MGIFSKRYIDATLEGIASDTGCCVDAQMPFLA
jgi:hypothetical protein